jgi:hypothetical protein
MKYTWDKEKENKNIEKHGFDFTLAEEILDGSVVADIVDDRFNYGEERRLVYSVVNDKKLCMCYVYRVDVIRVISIRRVHEKEWRKYYGDSHI